MYYRVRVPYVVAGRHYAKTLKVLAWNPDAAKWQAIGFCETAYDHMNNISTADVSVTLVDPKGA